MNINIKKRYSEYDFAKVVAMGLIVFHHYQQLFPVRYKGINFFGGKFFFGYLVEMFFIISGVFAYKWIKNIYSGKMDFIHFYLKRIIRLLPLVTIVTLTDVSLRII